MATKLIAEAQYTTAGLLLDFYENYFAKLAKDNGEDQPRKRLMQPSEPPLCLGLNEPSIRKQDII